MTLTAREAMQALLDGKTLMEEFNSKPSLYKLDDEGNLETSHNRSDWWKVNCWTLSHMMIYEEYSLTFEQALREMLDGKVVKCKSTINSRRFHDGEFQFLNGMGEWIQANWFENELQKGKWKVIE